MLAHNSWGHCIDGQLTIWHSLHWLFQIFCSNKNLWRTWYCCFCEMEWGAMSMIHQQVSNNKHLLNLNGILQKFNLMQEIRRFWQKNRLNLNGILQKFNSMQEIRSLWQLKSVEFECNLAKKNPMQEIRRFWQDESGGFECNLGKIETRSNFQARSRKSKDGKDKADGLAADQVNEQTPKIKI